MKSISKWVASRELWALVLVSPLFLLFDRWAPVAGLAILAVVGWCRWQAHGRLPAIREPVRVAIGLILAMAVVSVLISIDRGRSLAAFWRLVFGVLCLCAVARGLGGAERLASWASFVPLGCLGLAILCLVGTDWGSSRLLFSSVYERLPRFVLDLGDRSLFNPRTAGMALAMCLPLALSFARPGLDGLTRVLSAMASLAVLAILVLTQSVQAVLGLGAALLCLAMLRARRALLVVPLGLGALGAALAYLGPERLAQALLTLDTYTGAGLVLRTDIWSRAVAMIRDLPYTGIGLDTYPLMLSGIYPGYLLGPETHAHSLFLQASIDLGLPGLAAFLVVVIWSLVTGSRAHARATDPYRRALLLGCLGGIAAYLGASWMDTLWASKPGVLLWPLMGACLAQAEPRAARTGLRKHAGLFAALALLLPFGLSVLLCPGLLRRNIAVAAGHLVISQAESGAPLPNAALQSAALRLERVAADGALGNSHVQDLLGRTRAWLGEDAAALEAFHAEMRLDARDPMRKYAPYEWLRRRLANEPPGQSADDLLSIYGNWMNRFPDQAEGYVRVALVWSELKGDRNRAASVVGQALGRQARPAELLQYFDGRLQK